MGCVGGVEAAALFVLGELGDDAGLFGVLLGLDDDGERVDADFAGGEGAALSDGDVDLAGVVAPADGGLQDAVVADGADERFVDDDVAAHVGVDFDVGEGDVLDLGGVGGHEGVLLGGGRFRCGGGAAVRPCGRWRGGGAGW